MQYKILIAGASGLIGQKLVAFLKENGHQVLSLVRKQPGKDELFWDPKKGVASPLPDVDIVINLSGQNLACRWSKKNKHQIYQSRVQTTRLLVDTLLKGDTPPKLFLSVSAVGYYGDRKDEILDESSQAGKGFLSNLCQDWEKEAERIREKGTRVVCARLGIVLDSEKGALAKMKRAHLLGLGAVIGNGKQYVSWIHIQDVVRAINHIIEDSQLNGAINLVSPSPVSQREFAKALSAVLHRPLIFTLPAWLIKLILGEMGKELLISSLRVIPKELMSSGFSFDFCNIESSFSDLL